MTQDNAISRQLAALLVLYHNPRAYAILQPELQALAEKDWITFDPENPDDIPPEITHVGFSILKIWDLIEPQEDQIPTPTPNFPYKYNILIVNMRTGLFRCQIAVDTLRPDVIAGALNDYLNTNTTGQPPRSTPDSCQ
jgi:hypothetical protein